MEYVKRIPIVLSLLLAISFSITSQAQDYLKYEASAENPYGLPH